MEPRLSGRQHRVRDIVLAGRRLEEGNILKKFLVVEIQTWRKNITEIIKKVITEHPGQSRLPVSCVVVGNRSQKQHKLLFSGGGIFIADYLQSHLLNTPRTFT